MLGPPAEYTVKPANEVPPQPNPDDDIYEKPEDLLAQEELTQPSNETLNTVQDSCEPLLTIILTVH